MNTPSNAPPGWYPMNDGAGTRYWDGVVWTGDVRPQRRSFAAAAAHRGWGIALAITGGLLVLTSPAQAVPRTSVDAQGQTVTNGGPGQVVIALVLGAVLVVWGLYLLRGQGPTNKAVAAHALVLAEERRGAEEKARRAEDEARRTAEEINRRAEEAHIATSADRASVEVEQIRAIANPETAHALQNLQKLLYTRTITDEEFASMKRKLLGDLGTSNP